MGSNTITLIFCLGGITFLANWIYLLSLYVKDRGITLDTMGKLFKFILFCLVTSTIGVLFTGILFVSALMIAHG